ncbi:hypothetical protein GTO87_02835 [Ligilactobacillus saerimneri]|uniref:Uncharacterized protein n=1 Tax=Ligilactobacillus saerimneri TaxID=228229 RepID=A0A7H9EIY5_9LACO|nr:hypothetical protein [Ligilactobacillus saerimneri]QLL77626.1 hypothetical protein GTO87_02835 [Ligilactobacillus saerimneri]
MTDKEREMIIHLMGEVLADIQYIGEVSLLDKCCPLMDDAEELVEVLKQALGIEKLEVPDDTEIHEDMEVHNDPIGFEKLVRELGLSDEENKGGKAKIYNMSGERVDGRRTRKVDEERKEKE